MRNTVGNLASHLCCLGKQSWGESKVFFMTAIGASAQPDFARPLNNVSVPVGRDATFSCVVSDLGGYRVSPPTAPHNPHPPHPHTSPAPPP
ncbi:hypothetical protein E2C01_068090 [Portunus trituberculatus]|uniref:Ig-like domain-containing protein n=1 Tax=Portunus trituberculatus TaxID=210409 RepID=A0A5B7HUV5_PORTR|nr:hypothetical protein [Portunus trituberculatus]